MAVKIVDKRICRGSQDIDYVEILTLVGKAGRTAAAHKLRIKIRSNAYASQSYARVDRWDGGQWQLVHELGQGNMKTPASLYTWNESVHGTLEAKFAADRNELVRLAGAILS